MISEAVECQERRWRFFFFFGDDPIQPELLPKSLHPKRLSTCPAAREDGKSKLLFLRPSFPMSAPRFKPPTAELLQLPCSKIST